MHVCPCDYLLSSTLHTQDMMMYQSSINKDLMNYLKASFQVCWLRKFPMAISESPVFTETEACISSDTRPDAVTKWNLKLQSGNQRFLLVYAITNQNYTLTFKPIQKINEGTKLLSCALFNLISVLEYLSFWTSRIVVWKLSGIFVVSIWILRTIHKK